MVPYIIKFEISHDRIKQLIRGRKCPPRTRPTSLQHHPSRL